MGKFLLMLEVEDWHQIKKLFGSGGYKNYTSRFEDNAFSNTSYLLTNVTIHTHAHIIVYAK